jgi:hypothetical protein
MRRHVCGCRGAVGAAAEPQAARRGDVDRPDERERRDPGHRRRHHGGARDAAHAVRADDRARQRGAWRRAGSAVAACAAGRYERDGVVSSSSSSSSSQIGGVFSHAFERFLRDPIELAIPLEHRKWVPICLQWAARTIAVSIAYIVQKIISAAHSAMRGSQACGTAPHAARGTTPHHTTPHHTTPHHTTPHHTTPHHTTPHHTTPHHTTRDAVPHVAPHHIARGTALCS